jgi:hypothetical protein
MAFIDSTVINVTMPAIQASFHATVVDVQWVIESYGLLLAALILVVERLLQCQLVSSIRRIMPSRNRTALPLLAEACVPNRRRSHPDSIFGERLRKVRPANQQTS